MWPRSCRIRRSCGGDGDFEFLTDSHNVAAEAVCLLECADAGPVTGGNMAERVASFDDIGLEGLREAVLRERGAGYACKECSLGELSSAEVHGFC